MLEYCHLESGTYI